MHMHLYRLNSAMGFMGARYAFIGAVRVGDARQPMHKITKTVNSSAIRPQRAHTHPYIHSYTIYIHTYIYTHCHEGTV